MNKPSIFNHKLKRKRLTESPKTQHLDIGLVSPCEAGFLKVIEGLGDGVLLVDPEQLTIKRTNDLMCNMLGYQPSELVGQCISTIHPATSMVFIKQQLARPRLQEANVSENIPVTRKDGTLFFADINASLIQFKGQDCVLVMFRDSTARKEREEALRDSEEKYRALYDNAPQAYQSLDVDGRLIDLNDTWLKMLGYEREEVMGKPFADFLHPDWVAHFEKNFPVFKARGYVRDVQFKLRHKDGSFVEIELNGCIGYLPDGSFRKTYCVFQDITQRARAEELLKKSEETYRSLLNNLSPAVVVHSPDTKVVFANPAACNLLGITADQIEGRVAIDPRWIFLREDRSAMPLEEFPVNRLLSTGRPIQNTVFGIQRPDSGALVWVLVNGFIVKDSSGQCEQIIVTFVDVTERKNTTEMLSDERQRLAGILEGTHVGTWEWNVQTGALVLNERWAEMLGYTLAELGEITIDTAMSAWSPEDRIESERLLQLHFSGELDYYEFEARMKHKDGSMVWVLDRGKVVSWTDDHQPLMMMGTHQDITEQHLMQERLRQTEKMDAIGQLAGGVAHDFNNQLSGVLGYADLLESELTNPKLIGYAQSIIKASRRAAELTSQLLAFGRKGKNRDVTVDIHSVIGEVISMLERSVDKRISIKRVLNASVTEVRGDPTQIYNALLNLGINARDAMPEGGELVYETEVVELDPEFIKRQHYHIPSGRYLRICVTDTGSGMTKEVQRKLFEPFFTTKEKGKGTGLGLSSVYGTVKNHNGAIHVYSELGEGSIFRMYLPVSQKETVPVKGEVSVVSRGSARILLVDDEPVLRELGCDMLQGLGYQIETCEDGQTAVDYYREHWRQIDLVILDMMMPRLDGHQAFKIMHDINPDIRAILSSGYSINGKAQSIMDEGVKAFVNKPFSRKDLAGAVEEVLGMRSGDTK